MTPSVNTEGLSLEALADAADRANRLQRVTERLAGALTPQQVLDAILTEGLRAAEARAGAIGLITEDGQAIQLLAQSGYKGPIFQQYGLFSVDADLPMSYVARTGEPLFLESRVERNKLFPSLEGKGEDGHAIAVLPLALDGRLLGVIALSFGENMTFSEERQQMKITLARQAAQALERARLYAAEQTAARAARVPRRGERAARVLARLRADAGAARRSSPCRCWPTGARSTWSGPTARSSGSSSRTRIPSKVTWAGELQERYPPDPDDPHGVAQVIRTGKPEFFPELPEELLEEADRRRRRAAPERRRAWPARRDRRAAQRARPHARRADAGRRGVARRLRSGRLRARARARARAPAIAVDNARLYREAEKRRERGPRARARRRRRRPARPRRRSCATGTPLPPRSRVSPKTRRSAGASKRSCPAWDVLSSAGPAR